MAMHAVFVIFHKDINKSVIKLLTTLCMVLKKKHEYSDNSCPTLKQKTLLTQSLQINGAPRKLLALLQGCH